MSALWGMHMKESIMNFFKSIRITAKSMFFGHSPAKVIFRVYFMTVMAGTLLLLLPWARQPGTESMSFLDALFTATSAFSDTGLTLEVTSTYFSFFGQLIIILLIQVGGIGIMAVRILIILLLGKKLSISQRYLAKSERGSVKAGGIVKLMKQALTIILTGELIVAILFIARFMTMYYTNPAYPFHGDFWATVWSGIFHSISAFNNAGFDIMGPTSLTLFKNDYFIQTLVVLGLVIGGLGFPVLADMVEYLKAKFKGNDFHWSLYTKLSIRLYFLFFVIGLLGVAWIELAQGTLWSNPEYTLIEKIFYLVFHTFSTRNAGYATVDLNIFNHATLLIFIALMWIGANPSSTGGGIRTTTFGLILLSLGSLMGGKHRVRVMDREIPKETVDRAYAVMSLTIIIITLATIVVAATTPSASIVQSLFEAVSAFGTTGLSLGITASLSSAGKIAIILLMIIGQLGVTTTLLLWNDEAHPKDAFIVPQEDIIIG